MEYCDIDRATSPIVATNVSDLTIDHVKVSGSDFGGDAALRFYNSSPTITNTEVIGQPGSCNGIRFANYSSGSITHSTIRNCGAGNGIVVQGGSSPRISHNSIHNNNYHGIIVVSNDLEGDPVYLTGNYVVDNGVVGGVRTYCGIDIYDSEADIRNDTIAGSNYGVYADTYGHVYGDSGTWWEGRNIISSNTVGLAAYNTSTIMLGEDVQPDGYDWGHYPGGCNDITGSTYHVISNLWTDVYARGNWWGPSPDLTRFVESSGGNIYNEPMMQESRACVFEDPPGGYTARPEELAVKEKEAALARGTRALRERNVTMARDLFQYVYVNTTGGLKRSALYGLYRTAKLNSHQEARDLISPLAAGISEFSALAEDLLLDLYVADKDYASARLLANDIIERDPDGVRGKYALVKLASLKAYDVSQSTTSDAAINRLLDGAGPIDPGLMAALGGTSGIPIGPSTAAAEESNGPILEVYPNPFNPSTEIRFSLTDPGEVRLEVFDILGRSVEVLVDETKPIGVHSVTWNGGRYPSGMYILRHLSGGKVTAMKLLLTK